MKRTIHLFSLALIVSLLVSGLGFPFIRAQASGTWGYVGSAGFSDGEAYNVSLNFNNGTPYVAFKDVTIGSKASVMKFDGMNWMYVGSEGFSAGEVGFLSFAFANTTPFVAYRDGANGLKASVMKFNGTNWVSVGSAGFSAGEVHDLSLAFDNGVPYVAFQDRSTPDYQLTVMKFDGISWVNVGPAGFSPYTAYFISLAFDNGIPYVAFQDRSTLGLKASVMKFDGTNWVNVGTSGFSDYQAASIDLAFDSGMPYMAYTSYSPPSSLNQVSVMKFDGTNWVNVGPISISDPGSSDVSLAFNSGIPYVAFINGVKARVMKFDGTNWVNVGTAGFSSGDVYSISLAFNNDTPYVAFEDNANGNKASVMKYVGGIPAAAPTISSPVSPINDATPAISGHADPGDQVTISYDDSTTSDFVPVCENIVADATTGDWACPWPSSPFPAIAEGDFSLKAKAFDGMDYSADTVVDFVLDLTAPSAPVVNTPSGVINNQTPTISGTAEALMHVNVSYINELDVAVPVCQDVLVDGSGNWSCDSSVTLPVRRIQLVANATDLAGNRSADTSYFFDIDLTVPTVTSLVRASSNPTSAASVNFTVTFSKPVNGVTASDFSLNTTGTITGASIDHVSGSGSGYTVTVHTGSGYGALRLDVPASATITDVAGNALGGLPFLAGEAYTIARNNGADTTGVFRPMNGLLYLKNKNETGFAELELNYGIPGDYPVVGDWDGDGKVTIGVYRNGQFMLRNSNTVGFADNVFAFGQVGDQPIAGDWDGDGKDTIGIYRPSTGQFLLRNSNDAGPADASFYLGNVGDVGIAGDWNGDGIDTVGVFRPINGIIFLKNTNETGFAEIALNYGIPGDKPVTGDWNNDGIDTIGVYRNGQFMLRDSNTVGFADYVFGLGNPGDMPIAGNWDGLP